MNAQATALSPVRWSTSSFAATADTSPMELRELGAHLARCRGCRGRWFALQCAADTLHAFLVRRFVTTLAGAAAALALGSLLM
jgi:hypothetical protein